MFKMFYAENRNQLFKGEMRDETTDDEVREIRTDETGSAGYGGRVTWSRKPMTQVVMNKKRSSAERGAEKARTTALFYLCLKGKNTRSPGMSGIHLERGSFASDDLLPLVLGRSLSMPSSRHRR